MRLFWLVTLAMSAFAGNSVLNRVGVAQFGMDPLSFAVIRVAAGAAMLVVLVRLNKQTLPLRGIRRWAGAGSLALYMLGFSWAYLSLGAGLGALILFGVVQLVMFGWAAVHAEAGPRAGWVGALVSFAGLILLLSPGADAEVSFAGAIAMALAGVGWGAYSLLGRREVQPLAATAANFVLCLPLVLLALVAADTGSITAAGVGLAALAGAVTSGLGYALWYHVLPQVPATLAAVAQLSVPVLAVIAGGILLAEPVTKRTLVSALLVLGGIGLSILARARQRRIGSKGS